MLMNGRGRFDAFMDRYRRRREDSPPRDNYKPQKPSTKPSTLASQYGQLNAELVNAVLGGSLKLADAAAIEAYQRQREEGARQLLGKFDASRSAALGDMPAREHFDTSAAVREGAIANDAEKDVANFRSNLIATQPQRYLQQLLSAQQGLAGGFDIMKQIDKDRQAKKSAENQSWMDLLGNIDNFGSSGGGSGYTAPSRGDIDTDLGDYDDYFNYRNPQRYGSGY